jgi:hypothetical protein
MNDFFAVRRTTVAPALNMPKVIETWTNLHPLLNTIPEVDAVADYCRAIEGFRKVRPQAVGALKEHVEALDALVWGKELAAACRKFAGSVCQTVRPRTGAAAQPNR